MEPTASPSRLAAALEVLARGRALRRRDARGASSGALVERARASSRARLYQPIRVAITGTTVSPGIFDSLAALGRERVAGARRRGARRPRCGLRPTCVGRRAAATANANAALVCRSMRVSRAAHARRTPWIETTMSSEATKAHQPSSGERARAASGSPPPSRRSRSCPRWPRPPAPARALRPRRRLGPSELAEAVESDAALAIAVMRAANNGDGPAGRVGGVPEAVEALAPTASARSSPASTPTTSSSTRACGRAATSASAATRVAIRHAAERIAELAAPAQRDELAVAALLHDVGQLVLVELYGDEHLADDRGETPEERVPARAPRARHRPRPGRRACSSAAGACRRRSPRAIERHHPPDADGPRRRDPARRPDRPPRRAATRSPPTRCARPRRRSRSTRTRSAR